MPNKTISVPADVLPIIEGLDVPFSHWVAERLREHARQMEIPFGEQLLQDAALTEDVERPSRAEIGRRMGRSAAW